MTSNCLHHELKIADVQHNDEGLMEIRSKCSKCGCEYVHHDCYPTSYDFETESKDVTITDLRLAFDPVCISTGSSVKAE